MALPPANLDPVRPKLCILGFPSYGSFGASPGNALVLVTKRRKHRPECVAPRATEGTADVLYGTSRSPSERQRSQGGWFRCRSKKFMHKAGGVRSQTPR